MTQAMIQIGQWFNPLLWVGPVLDKELRVLSRRKRTYWIKGLFPIFLTLVVVSGWFSVGRGSGLSAAGLEGLARLSRSVVSSMTWLQFVLCQCMAVIMMSHAMHDEIRRRTLDVLMTTPIRTTQIVLGKLFGQLMMVWIILGLSFPVLAIVRVWGGVSWAYLVATWCVTVCATLCVASFSLFMALWVKRAHQAILIVLSFVILSYMANIMGSRIKPWHWLSLISSFTVFYAINASFHSASGLSQGLWVPHCALTLGLSVVFVLLCIGVLRRRILNTIHGTHQGAVIQGIAHRLLFIRRRKHHNHLRPVKGDPLLWKELGCCPRDYIMKQLPWIILCSVGLTISFFFNEIFFQAFSSLLRYVVLLRVGVMAALCVAQEKEARTWTALLATPIPDIWLLRHKAVAVLMKNALGWVPLCVASLIYLFIQTDTNQPRLFGVLGMFYMITTLYMVIGMGLWASVRMKTGAMAITATLIGWFLWQLGMQVVMMLLIRNMSAFKGGGGLSFLAVYYCIISFLSVVVGAVMFKLAGRNLRKYVF